MHDALGASLLQTRSKLAPFLDDGFVHYDRKKKIGGEHKEDSQKVDTRTVDQVLWYKKEFAKCFDYNNTFDVENFIGELIKPDDRAESNKLY